MGSSSCVAAKCSAIASHCQKQELDKVRSPLLVAGMTSHRQISNSASAVQPTSHLQPFVTTLFSSQLGSQNRAKYLRNGLLRKDISAFQSVARACMISLDLLTGIVAFSLAFLYLRSRYTLILPLPPGPRKLPFLGNLLDLSDGLDAEVLARWGKQYDSDIIHLSVAGTSILAVNSVEAANDLLEKRSSIYSNRVRLPMINELMGWSYMFVFMPYGPRWRAHRRLFHQEFYPAATPRYHPHELKATHDMLRRFLRSPDDFLSHLNHMGGAIIMSIAYGIDVLPSDDPYIETSKKAVEFIAAAGVPGAFLVDLIPLLKYVPAWLPGAGFQHTAREARKWAIKMLEMPFDVAKHNIASGVFTPSFTSHCLERMDENSDIDDQEQIIKGAAATMVLGGSDTAASAIGTFFLAMLSNPESQLKAQQELDSVLGQDRLPDLDDQPSLPYVTAAVKEALRWKAITPMGAPHSLIADDVYRGYRLPAGSIVISNMWAMLNDENMYPDPFNFKPERFLKDGKLNPNIRDPATIAFGFGRRICPGRHMGFSSVWIAVASILATFNITKAVNEDGSIIEPSYEYLSSLISYPAPFKCSIKPRSAKAENLIRATMELGAL